jgi:4-diphosphocytidyl-2-C-methyl-D-erythritol kinase
MRLLAPAKLNLHLRVAPVDDSGFHPLLSWMCMVALFDTLTIQPSGDGSIAMTCDDPSLPCDAGNLVIRAATALQSRSGGGESQGASLHLMKQIPSGGGLGGGSSDAARTLLGLRRFWHLPCPDEALSAIAATLGSDVPFFLHGASSICTGRGEVVRPISRPAPRWAVLILPGFAVATPAVYRMFDTLRLGDASRVVDEPLWSQWAELSAGPLLERLVNDLETPAFAICPQLATLHQQVQQSIGRIVRMSGSGSSLFTLFDNSDEAQAAVVCIQDRCRVRAVAVSVAPDLSDDLCG